MGMYEETFVGAYIELTIKEHKTHVEYQKCPNHPEITEGEFCFKCGTKIESFNKVKKHYPSYYDLIEEKEDELEDVLNWIHCLEKKGKIFLIGNYNNDEAKFNIDNPGYKEITLDDPAQCINNMKEYYKDIIAYLSDKCEKLEVKFGVIRYYS